MSRSIHCSIMVMLLTAICCSAAEAQAQGKKEPLKAQVKNSIDAGIKFLRASQLSNGSWEIDGALRGIRWSGGSTALTVTALLHCGLALEDPALSKGLKFLRDLKSETTYIRALQTMAYAEAVRLGSKEDLPRIQENVDWLLAGRIIDGGVLKGWSYTQKSDFEIPFDNSNTHYALLAIWAGKRVGAKIDDKFWRQIREFYVRTQNEDGSWCYCSGLRKDSSLTMANAGLCGLLIANMETSAGRETLSKDGGSANNCGKYEENPAIGKALGWIRPHFSLDVNQRIFYNLHGIGLAGRLSGERFFGNHDWYREGCRLLVDKQKKDGSWTEQGIWDQWPVVSSSFALMFLSSGRSPILISKVVHSERWPRDGDTDWNNDRNDLRNLTQFASDNLYFKRPLAWQSFDMLSACASQPGAGKTFVDELNRYAEELEKFRNIDKSGLDAEFRQRLEQRLKDLGEVRWEPEILNIVNDMLESPIMYINGHKSPEKRFAPVERELLRRYVDKGGFILVEACCGKTEFDRGFKDLARKLWPADPVVELEAKHPVWSSKYIVTPGDPYRLLGINVGGKTVLMYCPQDMSCQWEANNLKSSRGDRAFKLGANIIAYANRNSKMFAERD